MGECEDFVCNQRKHQNSIWDHRSLQLKQLQNLIEGLLSHEHGWVFAKPVDPDAFCIQNYFDNIEHPIDSGTVQEHLDDGLYETEDGVIADIILTFDNAMLYNEQGLVVHELDKMLKDRFSSNLATLEMRSDTSHLLKQLS
jgi:E1A/CREB-binding protein